MAAIACGGSISAVPGASDGGTDPPTTDGGRTDSGIPNSGFTENVCEGDKYAPLTGLTPASPVDYLELHDESDYFGGQVDAGTPVILTLATSGTPCATATDASTCNATLATLRAPGWRPPSYGMGGPDHHHYVVYTRGNDVGAVTSLDALATFLAPIDTKKDAALLASAQGHRFDCSRDNARETAAGYDLITRTGDTCGPGTGIDENLVRVGSAGDIAVATRVRIQDGDPGCVYGRRPEGFASTPRSSASPMGAHFSEMAELEAASVHAFERLAAELEAHGAPGELVAAARDAAWDEVAHARTTKKIAERFGAHVSPPRVDLGGTRTLFEVAVENAAEGCVGETFGALQATFQATHAADPRIARAMRVIAEDETRHAALAWEIAAWIEPLLSEAERAEVEAERRGAVVRLARALDLPIHDDVARQAGVPTKAHAAWLLDQVRGELWA